MAVLLAALGLLGVGLVYFRWSLPFYPAVGKFAARNLPFHRAYWMLTKNTEMCPAKEVFAGLGEFLRTAEAVEWAARRCRLRQRAASGLELWDTPYGPLWFPKLLEPATVHFAVAQWKVTAYPGLPLRRGDVVIDCGGFVGDWTKAALAAGASRVVTVEPAREQLECIRRNLAKEIQQGRVVVYPKGVWDREERLYLGHHESNPAAHAVTDKTSGPGEWIDLTSIDKMVAELKLDRVDVIKMDVEGAESRAVRGARETLHRFRPRLAIATEHTDHSLQNNRDVIQAVRETAPFYTRKCGYCRLGSGGVIPETLYFVP